MNVIDLIVNVVLMFVLMVPGIIMKKCKLASDRFGKDISNLVLYIAQPALIFLSYVRPFDKEILINSLYTLLFSVIAHTIFSAVALLLFKKSPDSAQRMLRFATIFANAAFMGMPLIAIVIKDEAALIYASFYNITFNAFLWTLGVHICTKDRDLDGDSDVDEHDALIKKKHIATALRKVIFHPVMIAAALGLVVFVTPLDKYLMQAGILMDSLEMLKNLVAPLSMLVIGLRVAEVDFRGFFRDKNFYLFAALRHLLLPVAVILVMKLFILLGLPIDENVYLVITILASTPAASSSTMFAEKYNCDAAYSTKLVAVSTVLSIATMPVVSYFAMLIY